MDIEALLLKGAEKGGDTLTRTVEAIRLFQAEKARDSFYTALCNAQSQIKPIPKTKAVYNKAVEGKPRTVRYRFAPLEEVIEHCQPALTAHGFSWRWEVAPFLQDQEGRRLQDQDILVSCIASHCDGHREVATVPIPEFLGQGTNPAQDRGVSLSYGERYTFQAVFGLVTEEDDDAESAGEDNMKRILRMNTFVRENIEVIVAIKAGLAEGGDLDKAVEAYAELTRDEIDLLNLAPMKGGVWTTAERQMLSRDQGFHVVAHARIVIDHEDPERLSHGLALLRGHPFSHEVISTR